MLATARCHCGSISTIYLYVYVQQVPAVVGFDRFHAMAIGHGHSPNAKCTQLQRPNGGDSASCVYASRRACMAGEPRRE